MPGAEMAQYGIGFFAIAGLIYVITKFLDKRKDMELTEVIENNTKAVEKVISVLQAIQLSLTRQEVQIDELLDRARR
ncbi:hypothetical protein ODU73_000745 [Thermoclostridium stercorarium]|jgi:hypothetical protein|uniref:Holin n=1 Tax=Thermoclostridium stercorarium subsp. leptospartum DSM 9219 TaxID=1346611 RepID=A0A1B1YIV6_THEST|nr:hypothetical protein [Thermoclostridium stercorarium]ANX00705.1 hypothetical protein CSTERLE_03425 [Thermoclostridium stercorarium subsp. leptospartum DSM 9219]UZQ86321.1 hypothetical protein ODU73_000745 [Thermoclostridium stercorarium]